LNVEEESLDSKDSQKRIDSIGEGIKSHIMTPGHVGFFVPADHRIAGVEREPKYFTYSISERVKKLDENPIKDEGEHSIFKSEGSLESTGPYLRKDLPGDDGFFDHSKGEFPSANDGSYRRNANEKVRITNISDLSLVSDGTCVGSHVMHVPTNTKLKNVKSFEYKIDAADGVSCIVEFVGVPFFLNDSKKGGE
jgi:hypothetical protein